MSSYKTLIVILSCIFFSTASIANDTELPDAIIEQQLQVVKNFAQFKKENPSIISQEQLVALLLGVVTQIHYKSQYNWVVKFRDMKPNPINTNNFPEFLLGNIFSLIAENLTYAAERPTQPQLITDLLGCTHPFQELYELLDKHQENIKPEYGEIAQWLSKQLVNQVKKYSKNHDPHCLSKVARQYKNFSNLLLSRPL